MRMALVVILEPCRQLRQDCLCVRTIVNIHVIPFEGFDEGFRHTVGLRAAHRREARNEAQADRKVDRFVGTVTAAIINDRWQLSKWARQSRIEEFRRTPPSHPRRWVVHICATCSMSCCFSEQQLKSECSLISSLIYLLSGGRPSSLGRCEQSHPKLSVNEMCQGALHRRCLSR